MTQLQRPRADTQAAPTCDLALVLTADRGCKVPKTSRAWVVNLARRGWLLISPTPIAGKRVWIKRTSPQFDRRFIRCRIVRKTKPETQGDDDASYCYGLQVEGEARRLALTWRLSRSLLKTETFRQRSRSRLWKRWTTRSVQRKQEESLVPLLSAIGLAVVYASNLNW